MTPEEMRSRVAGARVGRLATIDLDGRPNVVPIVFAVEGDTIYTSVDDKPKRSTRLRRLSNIERDPRVTILVDHYEEAWPALWWVRVRGTARVVEPDAERDRALDALRHKYEQYARVSPGEVVVAVDAEDWSGWTYA